MHSRGFRCFLVLALASFPVGMVLAQTCVIGNPCRPPDDSCAFYTCIALGGGTCEPVGPINCFDGDPCTNDHVCPNGQCGYPPIPDGAACQNDGCHVGGTCQSGVCVGASLVNCDDGNACTADTCDPATGWCTHTAISCDDDNSCTRDTCSFMIGCFHTGMGGIECDDHDECTLPDTCVVTPDGGAQCVGTPPSCPDDGNACTDEVIDPASCLCEHVPHGCAEPGPVNFADATRLQWPASPDASSWNTYRGTIPSGLMGSRTPGSVHDHACFEAADALGDGATATTDPAIPVPGTGFYYLVSGKNACAESPLGESNAGGASTPIPNPAPCP